MMPSAGTPTSSPAFPENELGGAKPDMRWGEIAFEGWACGIRSYLGGRYIAALIVAPAGAAEEVIGGPGTTPNSGTVMLGTNGIDFSLLDTAEDVLLVPAIRKFGAPLGGFPKERGDFNPTAELLGGPFTTAGLLLVLLKAP
jgi:hypothetical protein